MSTLKYWVWLSRCAGLDSQLRLALLDRFGSPEEVYYADEGSLSLTEGMTRRALEPLTQKDLTDAEKILADCERLGVQLLTLHDAEYPVRLRCIYDPPCLLYLRGRLPAVDELPVIAVVGTRKASPYGLRCAEELAFGLADSGAPVATGLARGIDSAAAQAALRAGGPVLGVLGGAVRFAANAQKKAEDIRAQASQAQESLRAKLAAGSYDAGKEATVSFRATNSTGTQLGVNVLFRVPVSLRAVDAGTGAGSVRFYLFSAGDLPGGTGGGG